MPLSECVGPFVFESNDVETDIVDLQIIKEVCPYALLGQDICYTVTVLNNSNIDITGLLFSDELADNLTYVAGSFEVDGNFETPMMADNIIQYPIDIMAGGEVIIKFCVRMALV